MLIPLRDIVAARERLQPYLAPTPVHRLRSYGATIGANLIAKLEILHPTHAFKVRGALNALLTLDDDQRRQGVVAASAGNHGLGLAHAAAATGARATVVLPESAPEVRAAAVRRLGADVIQRGEDWNAANQAALELAEQNGWVVIPPFDDPHIMAGQGTLALELVEQVPDLEVVVCSVGGGGLIAGVASALAQLRPEVRVVGVETAGADCMARSLAAGRVVELAQFGSIATSLGTRRTGDRQLAIVQEAVERVVVVTDEEALRDVVGCLDREKLFVEPAASCTLSALRTGEIPALQGGTVVPILCGANVTVSQVAAWSRALGLAGELGLP